MGKFFCEKWQKQMQSWERNIFMGLSIFKVNLLTIRHWGKLFILSYSDMSEEQGIVFDGVPGRQDQLGYFEEAMKNLVAK